jgi:rsbT co-antagonist protein RsbR
MTFAADRDRDLPFDEDELRVRREFFKIGQEDLDRLVALRPLAEAHMDEIVEAFYEHLLRHAVTRRFFPDDATVRRVKQLQRRYFVGLFAGRCDLEYVRDRLKVGAAHEGIGMPPKWYLGAYAVYLELVEQMLRKHLGAHGEQAERSYRSLEKLVFFDAALAMDAYILASMESLRRHQHAIRELSTPVIRVHDRVLLLPIVGTVDSLRAQQIMETVLTRVVEEQAKVVILDIAGVAVVDTQVADHLLKTTAAVKLLGAQSVLTGISPEVARTIVELGVDVSTMHTRSRLADGIDLALGIVGKAVVSKEGR